MAVILYIFCGKRYKVQVQVGTYSCTRCVNRYKYKGKSAQLDFYLRRILTKLTEIEMDSFILIRFMLKIICIF